MSLLQSVVNYDVSPPEGTCHWAVELEDAESANLLAVLPGGRLFGRYSLANTLRQEQQ
jgi:hypothetical protein